MEALIKTIIYPIFFRVTKFAKERNPSHTVSRPTTFSDSFSLTLKKFNIINIS